MTNNNVTAPKDRILVVDDDPFLLAAIHQTLTLNGYLVDKFDKPIEALEAVAKNTYFAIIADVKMPKIDGLKFLELVKEIEQDLPVIIITGHGDVEMAVSAMKKGAYDFLEKPVDEDVMLASLARAVEKMRLIMKNRGLSRQLAHIHEKRSSFHGLIGRHPLMQRLYDTIELVAGENDTVLISGETGTGKELVARAIHDLSSRKNRPFVAVNMGAIPGEMMEAELFGYEKGAFTGANQTKIGKFEFAGDGTLFLDEICSLPITLQAKLLRTLEDNTITRLGSNIPIPVKARIIAATNRNLVDELEKGTFRQDLFFRLNVLPIELPALRDRKSDIAVLVAHFQQEFIKEGKKTDAITEQSIAQLAQLPWPGNVRELKNHVLRLCIYGDETAPAAPQEQAAADEPDGGEDLDLRNVVDTAEKEHIIEVLGRFGGQVSQAHKALGISRKCLYDKIKKYDIDTSAMGDT